MQMLFVVVKKRLPQAAAVAFTINVDDENVFLDHL